MKKIYLVSFVTLLIFIFSSCGEKNQNAQGIRPTSKDTNIDLFESGTPTEVVENLQTLIKESNDNITAIEIMFTSSQIEKSSLDTIIVTITTYDNNKLSKREVDSIKSIITSSKIDKIIDYSKVEIMYSE